MLPIPFAILLVKPGAVQFWILRFIRLALSTYTVHRYQTQQIDRPLVKFGELYIVDLKTVKSFPSSAKTSWHDLEGSGVQSTRFAEAEDESFADIPYPSSPIRSTDSKPIFFKVDADGIIEIQDVQIKSPTLSHNQIGDIITFQFVSKVARSEVLGDVTNTHNLGPAIICTAINDPISSYRLPKVGEISKCVVIHTTLSNLISRLGENLGDYPMWFRDCVMGNSAGQVQRVLFSDPAHRGLIWPCFQLPVGGNLLTKWLSAKFWELLTVGLHTLKEDVEYSQFTQVGGKISETELLRRARRILDREYANPPSLQSLSGRLGLSQTRLKAGFRSIFSTTITQYCLHKRVQAAQLLLAENQLSISQIADTVGYEDPSAFSRAFRRVAGITPNEWRQSTAPAIALD